MLMVQNAFNVFVDGRPHPGSMVVAAGQHPPTFFVCLLVPAPI